METQSGARTPLVDPFGRELEEWLRDAPATRAPYLADLVVPPVTGPLQRPDTASQAAPEHATREHVAPERTDAGAEQAAPDRTQPGLDSNEAPDGAATEQPVTTEQRDTTEQPGTAEQAVSTEPPTDTAFRRPRDRARHAACAPSFPEPPTRLALRIEDLAVEVDQASGRPTIERIVLLEDEVRRRDEDLARLAAWEATVAELDDPEVQAARGFARSVFADLLADAAAEAARRDRAAARRAATGPAEPTARRAAAEATARPAAEPAARRDRAAVRGIATAPAAPAADPGTPVSLSATADDGPHAAAQHLATAARRAELVTPERAPEPVTEGDGPVRPAPGLLAVTPVSANTRPTPLVQPATGPTVIDRQAFAAALTAHVGTTASTPVVLPDAVRPTDAAPEQPGAAVAASEDRPAGWWQRLVARVLRALGRA